MQHSNPWNFVAALPDRGAGAIVLTIWLAVVSVAQAANDAPSLPNTLHGPLEHLQQSLVQSAQEARQIAVADRGLQVGDAHRAFHSLRFVFAHSHDAFTPVSLERPSVSSYQAALYILQTADWRVRGDWTADTEPLAAAALKQAAGDSSQIEKVARHFPYTPSGLRAYAATVALAESRGQRLLAEALVSELSSMYSNTRVTFGADAVLAALQERVRKDRQTVDSIRTMSVAGYRGPAGSAAAVKSALPWPQALWTWQESVWQFPQGVSLFAGLNRPEQRTALTLNSWQPVLTSDAVILRTPFRIVALSRDTGTLLWSLPTDTTDKPMSLDQAGKTALSTRPTSADEVLQMDDLGTVATSDRFVFFVDRFRKFTEPVRSHGYLRFGQRAVNLMDALDATDSRNGTRLVAIKRHPHPRVAWVVGDAEPFDYQFDHSELTAGARALLEPKSSSASSLHGVTMPAPGDVREGDEGSDERPSEFAGQHFSGVPLVYDQMLFVLSSDDETVWLNCLTEGTGRLLWQRPISYQSDDRNAVRGPLLIQADPVFGASLCGTDGETVLCALNSGVVIGVRLTDGQLQWATNVRGVDSTLTLDGRVPFQIPLTPLRRISFPPLLHQGQMVWAAPQSTHIHCLDISSGRIVWKASRTASGRGRLEGSQDHYAVLMTDHHVVLVGDRHVRALQTRDGSQKWATDIPAQTGRATCLGELCLVPLQDGTLASVDLQTGKINVAAQEEFTREASAVAGAVVADDAGVCVATPLSVNMFATTAQVLSELRSTGDPTAMSAAETLAQTLTRARAAILGAQLTEGVQLLDSFLQEHQRSPRAAADVQSAQRLLTEVLLRMLADLRFSDADSVSDAAQLSETRAVQLLNQLPLTEEQLLRLAVLTPDESSLDEIADYVPGRLPMLDLLPEWKSCLDVAAWSLLSPQAADSLVSFQDDRSFLSRIEHAILFPDHVGTLAEQLAFANDLIRKHYYTAAELFLLASLTRIDDDQQAPFRKQLNQLRSAALATDLSTTDLSTTASPPDSALAVLQPESFEVHETLHLHNDNRIAELLQDRHVPLTTPDWYTDRLLVGTRSLSQINMQTGAVSRPIRLPVAPEDTVIRRSWQAPGLVPLQGAEHVGMASLTEPGGPTLLWWNRLEREPADFSPLESGPVGPGFMIVSSRHMLYCLHPLTGRLLWKRRLVSHHELHSVGERQLKFAGDEQVIGIFGENLKSCEVFRTLDGQRIDTVNLDIPDDSIPLVSGRRVLYQQDQILKLVDLRDGTDLLAQDDKLKVIHGGDACLISEDRVVMVSESLDILVLDLKTARLQFRCSVADQIQPQKMTGITAFERDGRLFVLLKDWGPYYSPRFASAPLGDPTLASGNLFCLDSHSGQLLWHHTTLPSTLPQVYGDKTSLLVQWAWHNPQRALEQPLRGFTTRANDNDERYLVLTIRDAATGRTMIEQSHLSKAVPLRCVHNADTKTITVETESSEIAVTYGN